jgi:hypothetical protein
MRPACTAKAAVQMEMPTVHHFKLVTGVKRKQTFRSGIEHLTSFHDVACPVAKAVVTKAALCCCLKLLYGRERIELRAAASGW